MCQMCAAVAVSGACAFGPGGGALATVLEDGDAPDTLGGVPSVVILPGDEFLGRLSAGDMDYIGLQLVAGQTYRIGLEGRGQAFGLDTVLALYGPDGTLVAENDDVRPGNMSSALRFTATQTGTYVVGASCFAPTDRGAYRLSLSETSAPVEGTLGQMAQFLTHGYWQANGARAHAFDTSGGPTITVDITALPEAAQQLARQAMEAWEMVARIDFVEVSGTAAQITFGDGRNGAFATYVADGRITQSAEINVSVAWLVTYGTAVGGYGFQTYVHEIGHALGLGHQGAYNGAATYGIDEVFSNDTWSNSVMSYFSQDDNTLDGATYGFTIGTMIVDIEAIQSLYGAPVGGVTAGDTVWGRGTTLTNYLGQWFDGVMGPGGTGWTEATLTIFDESGRDLVDFSTDVTDQSVSLQAMARWNVFGGVGNVTLARGTVIEDYAAGRGNDSVTGNAAANEISGNDGNDVLSGLAGRDRLLGGAGNDRLSGDGGDDRLIGGAGRDRLLGGDGLDLLDGGGGADVLDGGLGNDWMTGGGGADVFVFGSGMDRITDFADDIDTIRILGPVAGAVSDWASLRALGTEIADGVQFLFGTGDGLLVRGVTSLDQLANDVVFV